MNSATIPGSLFDALRVGQIFGWLLPRKSREKTDVIVMDGGRWRKWPAMSESRKCAVREAIMLVSNHE